MLWWLGCRASHTRRLRALLTPRKQRAMEQREPLHAGGRLRRVGSVERGKSCVWLGCVSNSRAGRRRSFAILGQVEESSERRKRSRPRRARLSRRPASRVADFSLHKPPLDQHRHFCLFLVPCDVHSVHPILQDKGRCQIGTELKGLDACQRQIAPALPSGSSARCDFGSR